MLQKLGFRLCKTGGLIGSLYVKKYKQVKTKIKSMLNLPEVDNARITWYFSLEIWDFPGKVLNI